MFSAFRSLRTPEREHGFEPLEIEGTLPSGLKGTLYRVGPGTFESYGRRHSHWFDGHGWVCGVRFRDGRAWGASRGVSVDLGPEVAAGRQILGRFGAAAPSLRTRLRSTYTSRALANLGNTGLMTWGKRLFALYEAGHPIELNPETLETLGATDLGVARYSFTAHPKFVPGRNTTYAYGFRPLPRPSLDLYALPEGGAAQYLGAVPYNASAFVHDFVATQDYLVFLCPPIFASPWETIVKGVSFDRALRYQPHRGCELIVVPIDDPSKAWKLKVPGLFAVHTANGFQEGSKIVFDMMVSESAAGIEWVRSALSGTLPPQGQDQRACRFEIDTSTRDFKMSRLSKIVGEFPSVAPGARGRSYRHLVLSGFREGAEDCRDFYSALHRLDLQSGESQTYACEPGVTTTEAIFAGAGAELDGHLLALQYDSERDRTFCAVLDPRSMTLLAKAWFPQSVPFTFHGVFAE